MGVRLIFENSTAYRKSVPTDLSPSSSSSWGWGIIWCITRLHDCASSCVPGFIRRPFGLSSFHLLISGSRLRVGSAVYMAFNGEFDPGSGRTLAACLTHASRTERPLRGYSSGERVSNTWATCPQLRDNTWKQVLIPDNNLSSHGGGFKVFRLRMGPRPISLLVG